MLQEANGVIDNPSVFHETVQDISAGHYQGELVAIAAAEPGSIITQRIFLEWEGNAGLPAFLTWKPNINLHFMMMYVTAAALASGNKILAHPSRVAIMSTGANQDNHLSKSAWTGHILYNWSRHHYQKDRIQTFLKKERV